MGCVNHYTQAYFDMNDQFDQPYHGFSFHNEVYVLIFVFTWQIHILVQLTLR